MSLSRFIATVPLLTLVFGSLALMDSWGLFQGEAPPHEVQPAFFELEAKTPQMKPRRQASRKHKKAYDSTLPLEKSQ